MSGTVAKLELPSDEFALRSTLETVEGIEFEIERVVAYETDRVMPLVWVTRADLDAVDDALENDPSVEDLELLSDLSDERLYQMKWVEQIDTLIEILVEENGTIISAFGTEAGWNLRVIFPDRDSLSRTYDHCTERDLSMEVVSVYDLDEGRQGRFGLTDDQQDVLATAFDRGYYSIPRETTLSELADDLDASHQALSERMRRAHRNVVKNTVVIGENGSENPAESE
jgi:predicted DNA binding protein